MREEGKSLALGSGVFVNFSLSDWAIMRAH